MLCLRAHGEPDPARGVHHVDGVGDLLDRPGQGLRDRTQLGQGTYQLLELRYLRESHPARLEHA